MAVAAYTLLIARLANTTGDVLDISKADAGEVWYVASRPKGNRMLKQPPLRVKRTRQSLVAAEESTLRNLF